MSETTRVKIQGVEFVLNAQQKRMMKFFEQSQAIQGNTSFVPEIDIYSVQRFKQMLQIIELAEYDFPDFPPIKTSILNDVIGIKLGTYFSKLSIQDVNQLHQIAHFFVCEGIRKCAAAKMACHLFFEPTMDGYNKKRAELGVKKHLTEQQCKKLKQKYPQMI